MTTQPIQISDKEFDESVLQSDVPVLVDFWATWCPPCRAIAPILDELAAEYAGKLVIAKVNTEENQANVVQFGIQGIPTMILFKDGQEVDRQVGAVPKGHLKKWLDSKIVN